MSLIKSFNNILTNNSAIIGHVRNASTSPKRIQLKDQIIQQISTIMSLELNKIDTMDIETKLSIYFNIKEDDEASSYIKSLCTKISDIKMSTICKVKNFLNHNILALIENSNEYANNLSENNFYNNTDLESINNRFKSILKEVKLLNNNSRIKFKKLYDSLSNEYDKILSTMYDHIQKKNINLILDRLNRIEQIKNDILFDVTSIENLQNKFSDSIKNIINIKQKEKKNKNDLAKTSYNLDRTRTGKYNLKRRNNSILENNNNYLSINNCLSQSENDLYNKTFNSKYDYNNFNTISNNNINDENEIIKLYRIKIKEKKNEIDKLKQLLQQEKESKNKAVNELNKLQYSNKMSISIKNSQKNSSNLEKFNKLTEMIIGFTYSMNNLRNSLYQKTISHMDAKNIYGKLKMKLISLIEETYTLKKNITNNTNSNKTNNNNNDEKNDNFLSDTGNNDYDEEIIINENNNDNNDIKTIKEENENSQILSERESNKVNSQKGNIVNNNITLNTLPNYNIEALLEENKNLRKKLEEKIINYSDNINIIDNNEKEKENKNNNNEINNLEMLQKQIYDLKKIILLKDQELEEIRKISIKSQKEELNNVIQNNTKNLEQLKNIYQLLIDGKDNRIKELEEEIISYEKENELLKEENNKLKNECRKDKILSEAEVNNLKNQKIELQCLLEQGGGNNTLLNMTNIANNDNSDKEKIIKLENEIKIKNKQIMLLTQNHENDLKELNLAIEMLKQKISQLEEENICLSARNKKDNN